MLFDNLSPKTDFSSKIQLKLEIISGNILYLTHEMDKIHKLVKTLSLDKSLQRQVDEYFEKDETSPQTDSDTINPRVPGE